VKIRIASTLCSGDRHETAPTFRISMNNVALKRECREIERQPAAAADEVPRQKYRSERKRHELARGNAAHSELRQAGKAETQRPADRDLDDGDTDQCRRWQSHVAGAAQYRGQRIDQPDRHRAGEQHTRIMAGLLEHVAASAQQ